MTDESKKKNIAAELSRGMESLRQDADYTAEFVFVAKDVEAEVEGAKRFVDATRALLAAGGWTP